MKTYERRMYNLRAILKRLKFPISTTLVGRSFHSRIIFNFIARSAQQNTAAYNLLFNFLLL